ncbi:MAG: hypothetical protein LBB52_03635 [Desulfovibrio sp.]|jgi:shikimate kinase|nr:hypothetical protein [Desulfovibrio sp.]
MKKFFLIGLPNCGKSTLGKRAAETLGLPFYDTDAATKEKVKFTRLSDIFRSDRQLDCILAQRDVIEELTALDTSAIVATGAEVPLIPGCAEMMRKGGIIIYIQKAPESILDEMKRSEVKGLILENVTSGTKIVMQERAVELYAMEIKRYESAADVTLINDEGVEAGTNKMVSIITELLQQQ